MSGWYTLASGNQSLVVGTEQTLVSTNRPGRYQLWVDFNNLNALISDTVEIRHRTRLQSGDDFRSALPVYTFTGGLMLSSNTAFPELLVMHDLAVTAKQTDGQASSIKWELLREVSWKSGRVVADAGNSVSSFKTNLVETTNDHWKNSLVLFVGGALDNQVQKASAYNGTTRVLTVIANFTATPSGGDPFVLVDY